MVMRKGTNGQTIIQMDSKMIQDIEIPEEKRESTAGDSSDKSRMNQTIGSPEEIRESTTNHCPQTLVSPLDFQ
jgi:hypothetical protein